MGISRHLISSLSFLLLTLLAPLEDAWSTIYRCGRDPDVVTLTNEKPTKDCKKMVLPPPDKRARRDKANQNKNTYQSGTYGSNQTSKDGDKAASKKVKVDAAYIERGRIISEELELESGRLEAANDRVRALEKIPKLSPEQQKELLNYQKKQGLHQANVDLLQKELKK